MINKSKRAIITASNKGYKCVDGKVFYKGNEVKKSKSNTGYYIFSIRVKGIRTTVLAHRLVAYQKYGNKVFKKGMQVRHLDGNPLNNLNRNILIGTAKQNNQDKSVGVRMRVAVNATSFIKKHNHEKILKLRDQGLTYEKIMQQTNIKSKGTISFIINGSTAKKKLLNL